MVKTKTKPKISRSSKTTRETPAAKRVGAKKPIKKKPVKPRRPVGSGSRLKTSGKTTVEKKEDKKKIEVKKSKEKKRKYFETIGRRKTATARVRLFTSSPSQSAIEGNLVINDKLYKEFFPKPELQRIVESPLRRLKSLNRFQATIKVKGGGTKGQAEAIRHGLARALVLFDLNFRKKLKKAGLLTRDPRKKERKKYGLKKARRAPQWQKR